MAMLFLLTGGTAHAEQAPPARMFPQVPPSEPVFVSSKKPLKTAPVEIPVQKPAVPVYRPSVIPVQAKAPEPAVPEAPASDTPTVADALKFYQIVLETPSPFARFGNRDSEKMLEQRMRQQAMQRNPPDSVQFPELPALAKSEYTGRNFAPQAILAEANFVSHRRLYFEDKNAERYGWDLGFIQPAVTLLHFYKDMALLPYHVMTRPCQRMESSAGNCLPGDPVPYIIYPPEISFTGGFFEGAAVLALFAIFP
ncbi:MAG: hypothetical protein K8T89_08285 [Planctomycetes bacterium]|nr:hypothetical protein [Planctomycetota bacterium]